MSLTEWGETRTEVFLNPGDFHFGGADTMVRTLLGSCVSLALWHPQMRIGGMCHFVVPSRSGRRLMPGDRGLDGRYADEVVELFRQAVRSRGSWSAQYIAKAFGAGSVIEPVRGIPALDVPGRNQEAVHQMVAALGVRLVASDLGGNSYRVVAFDISNGEVTVRKGPAA